MFVTSFRGAARASVILFGMVFFPFGAAAEPLRLFFASVFPCLSSQQDGQTMLSIRLTDESRQQFAQFTAANVGKKIDIRINGKSVISPVVNEPLVSGFVFIFAKGQEETRRLIERLSDANAILEVEVSN